MLLSALQQASQFMTGPFGIALTILAVATSFFAAMPPWRLLPLGAGFLALFIGALAFSAAWAVNTFIPAGGGTAF